MINKILYILYKILVVYKQKTTVGKGNKILSFYISKSHLGNFNYIGPGVIINNTKIGSFCSIAAYTQIGGMEHDFSKLSTSTFLNSGKELKDVEIKDDVWIGASVYIKSGVTIGKGAVVGAGSVVVNDIPEYAIVVGVPARTIKNRFNDRRKQFHLNVDFKQDLKILKQINEDFNSRR